MIVLCSSLNNPSCQGLNLSCQVFCSFDCRDLRFLSMKNLQDSCNRNSMKLRTYQNRNSTQQALVELVISFSGTVMLQFTHAAVRNLRAGDHGTKCANVNTKIVSHMKSRSCRRGLPRSPGFFRGVASDAGLELLGIRSIAIAGWSSSCLSLSMSPGMLRTFANECFRKRWSPMSAVVLVGEYCLRHLNHHLTSLGPRRQRCAPGDAEIFWRRKENLVFILMILVRFEHPRTMLRKAMESEVRSCAGRKIFASSPHLIWPLAAEVCSVWCWNFLKKKFVDDSGALWTHTNNCFGRRWSPRSAVGGGGQRILASSPQSSSHLFRPLGAEVCSVWSWDLLKKFVDDFGALRTYTNNCFRRRWCLRSAVLLVNEPLIHHLNHHLTSLGPWRPWCTPRDAEIYWRRSSSAILSSFVPCLLVHLRWIAERCLCVGIRVKFLYLFRLWLHWAFEQCRICLCLSYVVSFFLILLSSEPKEFLPCTTWSLIERNCCSVSVQCLIFLKLAKWGISLM